MRSLAYLLVSALLPMPFLAGLSAVGNQLTLRADKVELGRGAAPVAVRFAVDHLDNSDTDARCELS